MAASNAPATEEKATEVKKPVVPGADQPDEVEEEEAADQQTNVQAETDLSNPNNTKLVATADATAAGRVVPAGSVEGDGSLSFTAESAKVPEPPKEGWSIGGMFRSAKRTIAGAVDGAVDTVVGAATSVARGAMDIAKSVYDSAAGVVNKALESVWDKEFGEMESFKSVSEGDKLKSITATDDGRTINSDGKITTVSDKWGNVTTWDGNPAGPVMKDKDGGTYRVDQATGDAIYEAKDGTRIVQHKDGSKEFFRNGTNIEQPGDGTLKLETFKLKRFVSEEGVHDSIKGYHETAIDMFSHGNQNRADVPAADRDKVGVHQFNDATERVLPDGTRVRRERDGSTWISHRLETGDIKMEQGPDGKPIFKKRNGEVIDLDRMPPRMRKAFESLSNGTDEAVVDGVPQVKLGPDGKVVIGDVTIAKPENGKINTEVLSVDGKPLLYENLANGVQTGPGMDGGDRYIYDRTKEKAYVEVDKNGNEVSSFNYKTDTYTTPDFTSNSEGIKFANGNMIHSDGSITNADGKVMLNSAGYSTSSPEYALATGKAIDALSSAGSAIGMAKADPKSPGAEGAIANAITDLGKAIAVAFKTGNFERLNLLFGMISEAQGALVDVKVAQHQEALRQQRVMLAENDVERDRFNSQHRVA
jgi:hypothetical protein